MAHENGQSLKRQRPLPSGSMVSRLFNKSAAMRSRLIRPNEDFQEELEREMLRAERYNSIVTLMLLGVAGTGLTDHEAEEALHCLVPIAADVKRRIDVLGWFHGEKGVRVGLILPHTQPSETNRMVDEIRRRFKEVNYVRYGLSAPAMEPEFEIYGYPVDGRLAEAAEDRQLVLFDDEELLGTPRQNAEASVSSAEIENPFRAEVSYPVVAQMREGSLNTIPLWKRIMDLMMGGMLLTLFSPLFAAVAVAIKVNSPGPVFYKQNRVGRSGKMFKMWKFRSMRADGNVNAAVHQQHLDKMLSRSANVIDEKKEIVMQKSAALDHRITKVGHLLRVTSIDELPQLINVMLGEMSLVGPRPCIPYEAKKYQVWCNRRFDVLPGLTGIWQVNGKNKTTFKQMVRMDIEYVRHLSPWRDIKILFMTGPTILKDVIGALQRRLVKEGTHVEQKA